MVSSLRRVLKHQQPAFPRLLPQYSSINGPDPLVFRIGSAETFFQSQTAAGFCGLCDWSQVEVEHMLDVSLVIISLYTYICIYMMFYYLFVTYYMMWYFWFFAQCNYIILLHLFLLHLKSKAVLKPYKHIRSHLDQLHSHRHSNFGKSRKSTYMRSPMCAWWLERWFSNSVPHTEETHHGGPHRSVWIVSVSPLLSWNIYRIYTVSWKWWIIKFIAVGPLFYMCLPDGLFLSSSWVQFHAPIYLVVLRPSFGGIASITKTSDVCRSGVGGSLFWFWEWNSGAPFSL